MRAWARRMPKTAINGMQAFDSGVGRDFPNLNRGECVPQLGALGFRESSTG